MEALRTGVRVYNGRERQGRERQGVGARKAGCGRQGVAEGEEVRVGRRG